MIVVDTNVLAYLFLPSPRTLEAERVLAADPAWAAPLLWRSEFRNVLGGYLRRGDLSLAQVNEIANAAEAFLKPHEYMVSGKDVLALVNQSNCSAYDCEFVSLAKTEGIRLITEDNRLRKAFPRVAMSMAEFLG